MDSIEFREERSKTVYKLSERSGILDHLKTPENRSSYFASLQPEGFVGSLHALNKIITRSNSDSVFVNEPNFTVDPDDPEGTFHALPASQDKVELLADLYDAATSIPVREEEDLHYQAAFTGFGLNIVHPFTNGNGRTARTMYRFMNPAGEWDEAIRQAVLDTEEARTYLNPALFREPFYGMIKQRFGTHKIDEDGALQPLLIPAATSHVPFQHITPRNRPNTIEERGVLTLAFNDTHLKQLATPFLVNAEIADRIPNLTVSQQGQDYFNITAFAEHSTGEDIEHLKSITTDLTREFARVAFYVLSSEVAKQQRIILPTEELGAVSISFRSLVTKLASGSLSLDRDGFGDLATKINSGQIKELE